MAKKTSRKKTDSGASGKATKKTAKKTTAKKTTKTTAKKTARKTTKKAAKKTAKKTARKETKTTTAKTTTKKTTKKAASGKTTGETGSASEATTTAKTTTKKTTKKKTARKASGGKGGKRAKKSDAETKAVGTEGVTVQLGGKKSSLSLAPGVRINGPAPRPAVGSAETDGREVRKLTKKELSELTSFLRDKRDQLIHGMRRGLTESRKRSKGGSGDEVDQATDAYDEDLTFEIATRTDEELEEIESALEKIEKDTYGSCEICGCQISPSRLKILPFATTCVQCRDEKERSNREDDTLMPWAAVGDAGSED